MVNVYKLKRIVGKLYKRFAATIRYEIGDIVDYYSQASGEWRRGEVVGGKHDAQVQYLNKLKKTKTTKQKKVGDGVRVVWRGQYVYGVVVLKRQDRFYVHLAGVGGPTKKIVDVDRLESTEDEYTFLKNSNTGVKVNKLDHYYVVADEETGKRAKVNPESVEQSGEQVQEVIPKKTRKKGVEGLEDLSSIVSYMKEKGEKSFRGLTPENWRVVKRSFSSSFSMLENNIALIFNVRYGETWYSPTERKEVITKARNDIEKVAKKIFGTGVVGIGDAVESLEKVYRAGLKKRVWKAGDFSGYKKEQLGEIAS